MSGRGVDQILSHPSSPELYEPYVDDAREYVRIAEEINGPIPRPVSDDYIWGYALDVFDRIRPDAKIINLETSITRSNDPWRGKEIHYRMNPENIGCLTAARIDCCSLANNHVLDWGYEGLWETLSVLDAAGIRHAGAGHDLREAERPAVLEIEGKGRVIFFSCGLPSSGIPSGWKAAAERTGVYYLPRLSRQAVFDIGQQSEKIRRSNDLIVVSIHWGGNWGYSISFSRVEFAHRLIDEAGVDLVHGHSSHHAAGIEIYRGKPIVYGCGDFINDYEGIGGEESYRPDLALMYFVRFGSHRGRLLEMKMIPVQIRKFRIVKASDADARWLKDKLNGEYRRFESRIGLTENNELVAEWK